MNGVLADTGPLYALLDQDDRLASRAASELAALEASHTTILVATSTLLEAYTLVLRRLGTVVAQRWLVEVRRGAGIVHPLHVDIEDAIRRVRRLPDQKVTLFDATLAAVSARLAVPIWGFDHHFDLLQAAVWRAS